MINTYCEVKFTK